MYRTGDPRVCASAAAGVGRADSTADPRPGGACLRRGGRRRAPGVARAAVVALLDPQTSQPTALVAHVLPDAAAAAAAAADERAGRRARDAARRELAAHAVPQHWMVTAASPSAPASPRSSTARLPRPTLPPPPPPRRRRRPRPRAPAPAHGRPGARPRGAAAACGASCSGRRRWGPPTTSTSAGTRFSRRSCRRDLARDRRQAVGPDLFDALGPRSRAEARCPPTRRRARRACRRPAAASQRTWPSSVWRGAQAPSVDDFWSMLVDGRDAHAVVEGRAGGEGRRARRARPPAVCAAAYLVGGATEFDAAFWRSRRRRRLMTRSTVCSCGELEGLSTGTRRARGRRRAPPCTPPRGSTGI